MARKTKTNWGRMARMTGLPEATLREALRGISGRRRLEIIKALAVGIDSKRIDRIHRDSVQFDDNIMQPDIGESDE